MKLVLFYSSQIGRCHTRESVKKQQNLHRAMEEVKRLAILKSPENISRAASPFILPDMTGSDLLDIVRGESSGL